MKALDRKLLRDLRLMWSQTLTIALVVASGVAGFITSFSAYDALSWSRDRYYAESRFADVFATLKRAPLSLQRQLEAIDGAAHVETTLTQVVPIDLPNVPDPVIGRLIGIQANEPQRLNTVHISRGRMVAVHRHGAIETLVSEGFAVARQLKPGDRIHALINGKREELHIVGIALSPEYIFAGLGGSPDQRGFGVFWVDRSALAAAYNMEGAFNQVSVRLAPQASEGHVIDSLNRLLTPYGGIRAHGRDEQLSHMILNSEIKEQRVLGTVLPSIFLAVAGFLLNVVLSRQIATQREQIAALKALGYDNSAIGVHYLKFVLVIVILGLAIGLAVGAVMGNWFVGIYADVFRFPDLRYRLKPELIVAAVGVASMAAVLATLHAIRATVRMAPAEAMRPPSPGNYKPMLIEKLGIKHWFSPAVRMILRTLERRPLRTGLTIFGIAASMAIVVTGAFWRDAIDVLINTQFNQVLRGDVSISLIEATPARVLHEFANLPHVTAVEGARSVPVRLVNAHHAWRGSIQGKPEQPELHRIVDIDHQVFLPPRDGLLLTDRLAERLNLRIGQYVQVELTQGRRDVFSLPVTGIVTEMMGMNAYIERRALNRLLREGDIVNFVSVAVAPDDEAELLTHLKQVPRVAAAVSKSIMLGNIEEVTARNVLVFSAVLSVFATIIAVGVVYNNARIALAERAWELASLRVLGFTRGEVSAFLLGELAIEIALALPLGMVLGYALAATIVNLIKNDEFYFPLVISPATYAYAALCVVAAGVVSALIVRRKVDTLDLVSVLKTRE
ncbi:MAG: ABC transporter permease [Gammaproteobacteria bacterium]|nr:ABC transporter permease [Gammaproteobacteria bacterium]MBU0786645.1 ABC transporter permease [Gammaproteobacteria bacterium]MBU0814284.1 ABC transporter permease [Gammaproteobacteria bacterium]MBU1786196.1 ABC transporter permease [Gammaproteobacteria bacterium]